MTAKVGAASAVEPPTVEMSGTTMTPASSAGTQKVTMFASKAGFVIPKNKLSGSLVPVFRGSKNLGAGDAVSGESKKQIQRKTKWGPDLTQDASVKKGRTLAYQCMTVGAENFGYSNSPPTSNFEHVEKPWTPSSLVNNESGGSARKHSDAQVNICSECL